MNYIFEEDSNTSLFNEYSMEHLDKDNKALSILDNALREFSDRELSNYDSSKTFEYDSINSKKSTSEIGTIGNDPDIVAKLQLPDFSNQRDYPVNTTDNNESKKIISGEAGSQMEKDEGSIVNYEISNLPSIKNYESQRQRNNQKVSNHLKKYIVNDDKKQSLLNKKPRNRLSGYSKWSRMDD